MTPPQDETSLIQKSLTEAWSLIGRSIPLLAILSDNKEAVGLLAAMRKYANGSEK